jgi:hypothetical protein
MGGRQEVRSVPGGPGDPAKLNIVRAASPAYVSDGYMMRRNRSQVANIGSMASPSDCCAVRSRTCLTGQLKRTCEGFVQP